MRHRKSEDMERYSNGKEPHWKCGVPQGIVRSSRILSASKKPDTFVSGFLFCSLKKIWFPIDNCIYCVYTVYR